MDPDDLGCVIARSPVTFCGDEDGFYCSVDLKCYVPFNPLVPSFASPSHVDVHDAYFHGLVLPFRWWCHGLVISMDQSPSRCIQETFLCGLLEFVFGGGTPYLNCFDAAGRPGGEILYNVRVVSNCDVIRL